MLRWGVHLPRPEARRVICRDCARPLRILGQRVSEHPGTVLHLGRGLCGTDYRARAEAGTLGEVPTLPRGGAPEVPPDEVTARRTRRDAMNLAAYILARRDRGLPNDGTLGTITALKEHGV